MIYTFIWTFLEYWWRFFFCRKQSWIENSANWYFLRLNLIFRAENRFTSVSDTFRKIPAKIDFICPMDNSDGHRINSDTFCQDTFFHQKSSKIIRNAPNTNFR